MEEREGESPLDFSTVLASSVHDMKNSVGMLLSSVETIIEEIAPEEPDHIKHFRTLQYEASRINGELVQLLSLYRMQNDFMSVHVDEHFVIDMIEDQIARNQVLIEIGNIQMTLACDRDLVWYFDSDLVASVIHNVIVNCIRYTKDAIAISAGVEDNQLWVCVKDNGDGYPDDMLRDPLQRVHSAQLSEGSTHLGLYFAQEIAALHKQDKRIGYIELRNHAEGGEFLLYLP